MNISYGVSITAPQTSGHPASLPDTSTVERSDTKVTAMTEAENQSGADMSGYSHENNAPPTAIQIRITEMLQKQAEALAQK